MGQVNQSDQEVYEQLIAAVRAALDAGWSATRVEDEVVTFLDEEGEG